MDRDSLVALLRHLWDETEFTPEEWADTIIKSTGGSLEVEDGLIPLMLTPAEGAALYVVSQRIGGDDRGTRGFFTGANGIGPCLEADDRVMKIAHDYYGMSDDGDRRIILRGMEAGSIWFNDTSRP